MGGWPRRAGVLGDAYEVPADARRVHSLLIATVVGAIMLVGRDLPAQGNGAAKSSLNARGWRASLGLAEAWQDNVSFALPNGPSDEVTTLHADAMRLWLTPRGQVTAQASGESIRFRDLRQHDRKTYVLALNGVRELTRRMRTSYDLRSQSALTNRSLTPDGDGPLIGLVTATTKSAAAALNYRATRRTDASIIARYQAATFDTVALANGWLAQTGAQLLRRYSSVTRMLVGYDVRRSEIGGRGVTAQQLLATWEHQLSDAMSVRLTTGASDNAQDDGPSLTSSSTTAGDSLGARRKHSAAAIGGGTLLFQRSDGSLSAAYQRSVGQVFGLSGSAVYTTDLARLSLERAVRENLNMNVMVQGTRSIDGAGIQPRISSAESRAGVQYFPRVGPALGISAFIRRQDERAVLRASGVRMDVVYGWSQARNVRPTLVAQ